MEKQNSSKNPEPVDDLSYASIILARLTDFDPFSFLIQAFAYPTWLSDIPLTLTQPNGQVIECFVTGDQYSRRIHDEQGYTILMNKSDGFYYYADEDNFGGLIVLEYFVNSGKENGVNDPEYLMKVESLVNFLRSQPNISSVRSYTDVVKRLNQNFNEDDESFYKVPNSELEAAQYLFPVSYTHLTLPTKA